MSKGSAESFNPSVAGRAYIQYFYWNQLHDKIMEDRTPLKCHYNYFTLLYQLKIFNLNL